MNKSLKLAFFVFFLLIFVNCVSADINLYMSSKDVYNLNDNIELSVSVLVDQDIRGFLKSNVECEDYNMDYYIIQVNLVKDDIEIFDIPELNLFENMLGDCKINILLLDNNLDLIEDKSSDVFTVTDQLILDLELNKLEFLPGDDLILNGELNYFTGQGVGEYELSLYLDGDEIDNIDYDSSKFKYTLMLNTNIKSNNHELKIKVGDGYGNSGEKTVEFFIEAVPTKLKNKINKLEFLPGDEVSIESLLYDQADDLIYSGISIKVNNPKNNLILEKESNTDETIFFTLDKDTIPGVYKIITKNDDFEIESEFTVLEFRDVDVYLEGGELFIKNKGNIIFSDKVLIDLGEFSFFEEVNLDVGEVKKIVLVGDVDDGEYDLTVLANNEEFDLGLINVKDDRSIIEKAGNKIAGNVVLTNFTDIFSSNIFYILLVMVVLVVLWFYIKSKKRSSKIKEIGISEGKKTLERIRTERARNKFGVKKVSFGSRREEKKDEEDKSKLFGMFD